MSCDVKLCQEFQCQKLLKSDNYSSTYSQQYEWVFFSETRCSVQYSVSFFETQCNVFMHDLLLQQRRIKAIETGLNQHPMNCDSQLA